MKESENDNLTQAINETKKNASDANSQDTIIPKQDFLMQHLYVPLVPTETGRRRHAAHQMQAPKFMQVVTDPLQAQHSDMYFG